MSTMWQSSPEVFSQKIKRLISIAERFPDANNNSEFLSEIANIFNSLIQACKDNKQLHAAYVEVMKIYQGSFARAKDIPGKMWDPSRNL